MNKQLVQRHAEEFKLILNGLESNETFTSKSCKVDGHKLSQIARKKLITLVGYDKKRRINIYRIPYHQINMIQDVIEDNNE